MSSARELEHDPSNKKDFSALLIGDEDAVDVTTALLQDTLLRFGSATIMKSPLQTATALLDIYSFHFMFVHLSLTQPLSDLKSLQVIRNNQSKRSEKVICIVIIPEIHFEKDLIGSVADFIFTKPLTLHNIEMVLKGCDFMCQRNKKDSNSNPNPGSDVWAVQKQQEPANSQWDLGPSIQKSDALSLEPPDQPDTGEAQSLSSSSSQKTSCTNEAFLHSRKEQKRRLQIKKCCNHLRDLLPFLTKKRVDTASVLEMTVKYIKYLQCRVPEETLSKVIKALEEKIMRQWYKPVKLPTKRKYIKKKNQTSEPALATEKQIDEDLIDNFIAANVLGRCIQPALQKPSNPCVAIYPPVAPVMVSSSSSCSAVSQEGFPTHQPPGMFMASDPSLSYLPSFSSCTNLHNPYTLEQSSGPGVPQSSYWPVEYPLGCYENSGLPFANDSMAVYTPQPSLTESTGPPQPYRFQLLAINSSSQQPAGSTGMSPFQQYCNGATTFQDN
ncbi:spermatogenesis- and oogenesis-specific basic helix-loop-helix-containing protein 2 isoform X1 [Lepisosteus oculatus]|uniref:spermatogenesis- and oogenesis-specific basic helix-loop-helix-containing protein 2 isoform X1 n=2 Tax=Lepisosteus oculatus TaxID=7918 RepID=UPI00371ED06E